MASPRKPLDSMKVGRALRKAGREVGKRAKELGKEVERGVRQARDSGKLGEMQDRFARAGAYIDAINEAPPTFTQIDMRCGTLPDYCSPTAFKIKMAKWEKAERALMEKKKKK